MRLMESEERIDTAYHEAGHTVIAYLNGFDIGDIDIIPDEGKKGGCIYYYDRLCYVDIFESEYGPRGTFYLGHGHRAYIERLLEVYSAGSISAGIYRGEDTKAIITRLSLQNGFGCDYTTVMFLTHILYPHKPKLQDIVCYNSIRKVETIMQEPEIWLAIETLTKALLNQGKLQSNEIVEILEEILEPDSYIIDMDEGIKSINTFFEGSLSDDDIADIRDTCIAEGPYMPILQDD